MLNSFTLNKSDSIMNRIFYTAAVILFRYTGLLSRHFYLAGVHGKEII